MLYFGLLLHCSTALWVLGGYVVAMMLMLAAAGAEFIWGVKADGKSLQDIAAPLSSRS